MNVNFEYKAAGKPSPVYFEQIFAEKPAGGRVANPDYDVLPTTAVYEDNGLWKPIKGYRLYAAVDDEDTTIKVCKGSGVKVGDIIGHGTKAVACTAVSTSNADYDLVTVTLGLDIAKDAVLYEAASASADAAAPKRTPKYITYDVVEAGKGDQITRLVNGANIRKETANIADEVAALLPTITLI